MAKTAQEKADLKAEKLYEKTHKRKYRLKPGDIVFNILNYLFFTLFTIACIFPFYYLFINTISDNDLVIKGLINFIPRGIHFDNYTALLNVSDLSSALIVSLSRTVLGTALMVAASGFIGYLVTKDEMWGRKFWYRFLVITMYFNAGLIPWFLNMQMLGLTNTFWAYIIPGIVAPYNIILVKTYIESIPAELEESAQIDGASFFTVFRKIIWPLSKPILATIAIFGAVGHWNSFTDSLILMTSAPKLYTLQHRLYIYLNQASNLSALMESGGSVSEAVLKSGMPVETAFAIAVPVGILGAQILSLIRLINTTWVHMADKYAEKGNTRGIYLAGLLYPSLARIPITVTPVAVAVYFGAAHIDKILAVIPEWLMNGLTVAGGMLPALGFAIVIKIIGKKELLPYFVAGYFILKLSGIGILPLSIFGVIAAYLHIMFTNKNSGEVIANGTAN